MGDKAGFYASECMGRDCGKPAGFGWIAATPGSDKAGFYAMGALLGELRETIVLGKKNKILRNFLKKKTFQKKIVYLRKFLKDHAF